MFSRSVSATPPSPSQPRRDPDLPVLARQVGDCLPPPSQVGR